ncbi:MAG: GatB/YqeY domain-containing protein [Bdellovibrio sp.]|nr:GatB/YqeY domain-containing protein [Bdellovibrio sp.]
MPTIKERLSEIIKNSMKSGDKDTLGFARNLHAAVRKEEIDGRTDGKGGELDDAGVIAIITKLVKQRKDSIDQFAKGGREDLVKKETAELTFLQGFLPAGLSEAEVRSLVDWAVTESKAASAKDMGQVMKLLMPKIQGRADAKLVNQLVREKLG